MYLKLSGAQIVPSWEAPALEVLSASLNALTTATEPKLPKNFRWFWYWVNCVGYNSTCWNPSR